MCWGCRLCAVTMTKTVPGISLLLQQSHKLFSTIAQCLSTIHFCILPLRLWQLLFSSPVFCLDAYLILHMSALFSSIMHYFIQITWFHAQCCRSVKVWSVQFLHSLDESELISSLFLIFFQIKSNSWKYVSINAEVKCAQSMDAACGSHTFSYW